MKKILTLAAALLFVVTATAQTTKKTTTPTSSKSSEIVFFKYNPEYKPFAPFRLAPAKAGFKQTPPKDAYGPGTYYVIAPRKPRNEAEGYESIYVDLRKWLYFTEEEVRAELVALGGVHVTKKVKNRDYKHIPTHLDELYQFDNKFSLMMDTEDMFASNNIPRVRTVELYYLLPITEVQEIMDAMWSSYNDWCYMKSQISLTHGDAFVQQKYPVDASKSFNIGIYFNLKRGSYTLVREGEGLKAVYIPYEDIVKGNLGSKGFRVTGLGSEVGYVYKLNMEPYKDKHMLVTITASIDGNLADLRPHGQTPLQYQQRSIDEFNSLEPLMRKGLKDAKSEHLYRD